MKIFLLSLFLICSTTNIVCAKKQKTLNLVGKNISDVSVVKVPDRVRRLLLSSNNITSLEGLDLPEKLKTLDLSFNKLLDLNGLNLNTIRRLDVDSNPTIANYSKLEELNDLESLALSFNNLDDTFDFNIVNKGISKFFLVGNAFKTLDLSMFSNLLFLNIKAMFPIIDGFTEYLLDYSKVLLPSNLKIILMGGNDFGDQDFSELVLPDSIEEIDMATSSLDQEELKTLNLPPNLKKLRLKRNSITNLDDIEFPDSLEVLNLQLNPLTKEEKQKIKARFGKKVKVIFKCGRKCQNSA